MRHAAVAALVLAGFGLVGMATRPAPRMPPYLLRPGELDALLTYVAWLTPPEECGPECPRDAWPDPKAAPDPCRMPPPSRKASLLGPDPKRPRWNREPEPLSRPRR